jgi:SAM-dependent methyltransferase
MAEQADARIGGGERRHDLDRVVGRGVVDDDDLVSAGVAFERPRRAGDRVLDVLALVEHRNDDGDRWRVQQHPCDSMRSLTVTTLSYARALDVVRRSRRRAGLGTRLHVLGRFLSCPFLPVVAALPGAARVLDVGSGHGIFAYLAAAAGARAVVALEPDRRKMLAWAAAGGPVGRVFPVCGYLDAVAGGFDAVAMLDVLYRLPSAEWDGVLGGLFDRLRPGGRLLLKEIDPDHRIKGWINRLQERAADAVGLTLGDAFTYESPAALGARLRRLGFVDVEHRALGRWYPHAHVLYLARRP